MSVHQEYLEHMDNEKHVGEGTSRRQRYLPALEPSSVAIDERRIEHDMLFASKYASYLNFFDEKGHKTGTWEPFFSNDSAVLLAETALQDIERYRRNIRNALVFLENHQKETEKNRMVETLLCLFSNAGVLASGLDTLHKKLPDDIPLKTSLGQRIQSELAEAFRRLIAIYKAGLEMGIYVKSDTPAPYDCESNTPSLHEFLQQGFSDCWKTSASVSWHQYIENIATLPELYGGESLSVEKKINHLGSHNRFTSIFETLLAVYARTILDAGGALEKAMTERNDHEPHYTLFLVFLRLLQFVRNHINTLTERHLDFYYREVLRFAQKPPLPNHVHLVFELARQCDTRMLNAGTSFPAGKDSKGRKIAYALDEDVIINKARVAAMKSLHLAGSHSRRLLYADPDKMSSSAAQDPQSYAGWNPFGENTSEEYLAQTGFAIASHYLLLEEGHRTITLGFDISAMKNPVSAEDILKSFDFHITAEKGWLLLKKCSAHSDFVNIKGRMKLIRLQLQLDGSQPAAVALQKKIHGSDLPEGLPVLKAIVRQNDRESLPLEQIQNIRIKPEKSFIEVSCGYNDNDEPYENGLKNIGIANSLGLISPDKPFMPFGPEPETGDYLIIGSDEAFQKKGARIQLRLVWKGLPENDDLTRTVHAALAPDGTIAWLENGIWSDPVGKPFVLFPEKGNETMLPPAAYATLPDAAISDMHIDRQPWSIRRKNGFMKISITANFGHRLYRQTLSRHMIKAANNKLSRDKSSSIVLKEAIEKLYMESNGKLVPKTNDPLDFQEKYAELLSETLPVEPYTPEISSITMSYKASSLFSDTHLNIYHLTPFGYLAIEKSDRKSTSLIPSFLSAGEFYIGIENFLPPGTLNLLFQISEGSADPMTKKPKQHVVWSYLSDTVWKPLERHVTSDTTEQFTRSGIIRFLLPSDATTSKTLFTGDESYWLKAEIKENPGAVCRCLSVTAQAARATCITGEGAPFFPETQLEAGTIAKMETPDASIRKIQQPYPSFGGRPGENNADFRVRVSERVRHKNRAVTQWDYERLILEAFPFIYKVKCLNHTWYEPGKPGEPIFRDPAPGHVSIVTIPDLKGQLTGDPLRPYTSLGDLERIKAFLDKHVSPFTTLHVHNPMFETVKIECGVKFFPGLDTGFHLDLFRNDLVRFLSPWAFENTGEVLFAGRILKSSLIDFMDERPYVDFVTDFRLFHIDSRQKTHPDQDEIIASTPISILVSAAAQEHVISVIQDN